jgi:3'(2'), 5'-bisphosphate nucleotidase
MNPGADETRPEESTWNDHEVSRQIAAEAGRLLVELRRSVPESADQRRLRDEGDARSHTMIIGRLAELRSHDGILSEEAKDNPERLRHQRVWVVDPLDGTREFGEPPRDDWAVHVALCINGEPVAGSVALPAQGRVFSTADLFPEVAAALGADLVFMGSAGAKAMTVVSGGADIYLHAGGQYEWDSAAPVAVAIAAGLHCSRIDGSPLVYNQPNPYLPDLLICKPSIAQRVLALVAAHIDPIGMGPKQ